MLTYEQNVKAILECIFAGYKDELIDIACKGICTLKNTEEQKKGHWIKTPKAVMGEGYLWYCDKCEHQVYQDSSKNYPSEKYCSNCGAKMSEIPTSPERNGKEESEE